MPSTRLIGRADDLRRLTPAAGSVVVLGAPGLGSTAFLDAVAEAWGAVLVSGRASVPGVPFVPVAALLAEHDLAEGDPLAAMVTLPGALKAARRRVVVDDADRLDEATAVLLGQVARAGVPIVVGVHRVAALAGGLRDLALTLPRVTLAPLGRDDIAQLAQERAGAALDPPTLAALWRRTAGAPALAADLVDAALAQGASRETSAGLHLTRLPASDRSLAAHGVATEDLERHRALLQRLAATGPLPLGALPAEELAHAIARGLVAEDGHFARVASPLVADRLLAGTSPERIALLAAESADRSYTGDDPEAVDRWRAHAAVLRTLAGTGEAPAEAAEWLRSQDRREEALAVLGRAVETGVAARLVRADVLIDLGRLEEALETLDALAVSAEGEPAVEVFHRWVSILGSAPGRTDALERRARELAPRLPDRDRARVEAALARRSVIRGDGRRPEPADPMAALLHEALSGSLETVRRASLTATVREAQDRQLRTLVHFLSLVYDGRLVEAREIADHEQAQARVEPDPILGVWDYNRTKIAFHAGQLELAAARGEQMARHLAWRDPYGLAAAGRALLAATLARSGRAEEASRLVAELGEGDLRLPRVRIGVARVRAEELLDDGRRAEAADALAEAGLFAVANDEAHSGHLALDEAFWLDPTPGRAAHLIDPSASSGLVEAFGRRARALLDGERPALEAVARDLEEMIQPGRAAATWEAVSGLAAGAGDRETSARAARQCARLVLAWGARPWPSLAADRLSARELEVARAAATRRRSRLIAEDLGLSVRTVDNHLARVFRKLGVTGRDELAEVLGLVPPPGPARAHAEQSTSSPG